MHRTSDVDVKFDVVFEGLEGLPQSSSLFFVSWSISRGLKQARSGESKKVVVDAKGDAALGYQFSVTARMHQKGGKFESRLMKIVVKEEAKKKARTAFKLVIELADFAAFTSDWEKKVFNLQGGKQKPPPRLSLRAKASYTKIDGKAVTNTAGARSDGTQREAVEVGGQLMFLATDQDLSDEEPSLEDSNPFGAGDEESSVAAVPSALFKKSERSAEASGGGAGGDSGALFRQSAKAPELTTMQVLEDANRAKANDEAPGGALFRQSVGAQPKPKNDEMTSTMAVIEEAHRLASPRKESADQSKTPPAANDLNPFGAPSSPKTPSSSKKSAVPGAAATPNSEEMEMLRRQNKLLKETLDKQEKKIDALRVKMHDSKNDTAVREKQLELDLMTRKWKDSSEELEKEKSRSKELAANLAVERRKAESLGSASASATERMSVDRQKLEQQLAAERNLNEDLTQSLAELKRVHAQETQQLSDKLARSKSSVTAVPVTKGSSDSMAHEQRVNELENKVNSLNRELSGQQLTVIELTNRLREAEAAAAAATAASASGNVEGSADSKALADEVNSLQMQIVAMEQDYESQIEELRTELEEAQPRLEEQERVIESLRSEIATLKKQAGKPAKNALSPRKNPLMVATAAPSPFSSEEFEKLTGMLNVQKVVNDCVWLAPVEYDKHSGAAVSSRLIIEAVRDDPGASWSLLMYEKLESSIERAASNQMSLQGRMHWLNVLTNVLDGLSKLMPDSSVKSPKVAGVKIIGDSGKKNPFDEAPALRKQKSVRDMMQMFAQRMEKATFVVYQLCVDELRDKILPGLADAVFAPTIDAVLGARHTAVVRGAVIVEELDSALRAALATHLLPAVAKQFFDQVFYSMGATIFNAMTKRDDLSASRSIAIKLELAQFDHWPSLDDFDSSTKDLLRNVADRGLSPVKEVTNLLLVDKATFLHRSAVLDMAPSLNARQVKSFLTAFVPDDMCPDKTPQEVLSRLTEEIGKQDSLTIDARAWTPYRP